MYENIGSEQTYYSKMFESSELFLSLKSRIYYIIGNTFNTADYSYHYPFYSSLLC